MAKVAWNEYYSAGKQREHLETTKIYLTIARQILDVYGEEGDSGGPLEEANTLLGLIQEAQGQE